MAAEVATTAVSKVMDNIALGKVQNQIKCALIYTPATATQGDSYTFDLSKLGGTTLQGVYTVVHSTANSILAANAITTAVSGTTITFTIPAAGGTKIRATKVYFT